MKFTILSNTKKMSKKLLLITLVMFGLGSFNASAQSNLKLAHFNYQNITDSLPTYEAGIKKLAQVETEINEILMELNANYESLIRIYQSSDSLSTLKKERLEEEIQISGQTIQMKTQEYQETYQNRVAEIMTPIDESLKKAVKIVAKRHKLNYVFEETTLMYVDGGLDLTDEIKAELTKIEKERTGI